MPLLDIQNVSKRYLKQNQDTLYNISLQVKKGELLSIVGESGSGKTTLLKLIAGLEDTDSGTILLENELVTGPSGQLIPGHPKIKMVFQDNRLFPNISIYDNVLYVLRQYNKDYQQERTTEVLELCKLTHLQDKYPRELSGGEQQRATLARALADEPLLLLLDEPFSHLDMIVKRHIKQQVQEIIRSSGVTAIFVTHDTTDALSIADRIAVIKDGVFIQTGNPQQIYEQPANPYIATFFGNANILNVSVLLPYLPGLLTNLPVNSPFIARVCIRAEDIHITTKEQAHCKGKVIQIEYAGAYLTIQVQIDKVFTLTLHTPVMAVHVGEWIFLKFNLKKIYLFGSGFED